MDHLEMDYKLNHMRTKSICIGYKRLVNKIELNSPLKFTMNNINFFYYSKIKNLAYIVEEKSK